MTSYVTIPNTDIDAESPIDVDLATAWRDNPTAITEGSAGAPKIQTAALEQTAASEAVTQATIRDSAVGQAQLVSATASQSAAIGASGTGEIVPTGSNWTLGWFASSNSTTIGDLTVVNNAAGTYSSRVGILNNIASTRTFYLASRYIQASPPWNLGNGDIALFVTAKIDRTTKEVLATEIAPDPHWAYHGPHELHPHHGKLQKAAGLWGVDVKSIITGIDTSLTRDEALIKLDNMKMICADPDLLCDALSYEFTMEEKNIDMNLVPHGFGPLAPNEMVVLIDPAGGFTDQLGILHESMSNAETGSISTLLHEGHIVIGDALGAITPAGVTAVSAAWKNTA